MIQFNPIPIKSETGKKINPCINPITNNPNTKVNINKTTSQSKINKIIQEKKEQLVIDTQIAVEKAKLDLKAAQKKQI